MFGCFTLKRLIRFELTGYVEQFCKENRIPFDVSDTVETGESYRLWEFYLPKIGRGVLMNYVYDEIRKIEEDHPIKEEAGA